MFSLQGLIAEGKQSEVTLRGREAFSLMRGWGFFQ